MKNLNPNFIKTAKFGPLHDFLRWSRTGTFFPRFLFGFALVILPSLGLAQKQQICCFDSNPKTGGKVEGLVGMGPPLGKIGDKFSPLAVEFTHPLAIIGNAPLSFGLQIDRQDIHYRVWDHHLFRTGRKIDHCLCRARPTSRSFRNQRIDSPRSDQANSIQF